MSFFGKFKSNATPASPNPNALKKDGLQTGAQSALDKHIADLTGPIRLDGSDKYFGFENYSSTCYCNSIIQCLYFSHAFRNKVINFPPPAPEPNGHAVSDTNGDNHDSDDKPSDTPQRLLRSTVLDRPPPSQPGPLAANSPARKPLILAGTPAAQTQKPDEKDSPEWKKKTLMQSAPMLDMQLSYSDAYGMQESLFTALKDIFEAILTNQGRTGIISPHKFLEILRKENEMFRSAMHQDAHEFLNLLLNQVVDIVELHSKQQLEAKNGAANGGRHSEINGMIMPTAITKAATGWVHDLFEGLLVSETRCLTCENTSQRDEAFMDLSVDLDAHSSVTSCLRKFSEEEMLCERNKFHCDNCGGLQEAEKRMKIKRLPRILALHLKRFKYTEDYNRLQKLFHRVVYPYHLRLFNTTDDADDQERVYELYAVVVHIGGGPYHGHYVSIIKTQDHGWLLFDDELVEPVDRDYVRNFFGGEPKIGIQDPKQLACAYVLFYQETTLEAMEREEEAEAAKAAAAAAKAAEAALSPASPVPQTSLWSNGFRGAQTITTPTEEKDDSFAHLSHAVTAPATFHPSTRPNLDGTPTASPALTASQSIPPLKSKKDLKREEKERKAAEKAAGKEAEKAQKQKLKDAMDARRERVKRAEEELQHAIEMSKQTKADEDARNVSNPSATPAAPANTETIPDASADNAGAPLRHSVTVSEADRPGFGARLRHSSIGIRPKKPFWSSGRKESTGAADAVAPMPSIAASSSDTTAVESPLERTVTATPTLSGETPVASTPVLAGAEATPRSPVIKESSLGFGRRSKKDEEKEEQKDKEKQKRNRFSINRKKSVISS